MSAIDREDMNIFKEAWMSLDPNGTERRLYMNAFDKDNDGCITLEEFCRVLRMTEIEVVSTVVFEQRVNVEGGSGLPQGVQILFGAQTSELEWQARVARLCLEGLRFDADLNKVVKWIKETADERFTRLWHCVIVKGQHWCFFSYEPGYAFVLRYDKYVFIIWKTPMI
uniref:EF-hand domain-containing protein n=1 Tax=Macrostomum lignano TaxID=282301 RepID=A0A1I8HKM1_9PLAT